MATDAEKKELWAAYKKTPTIEIRNKLVEAYLGYAKYLAWRWWKIDPYWCEKDDLESVASMAVIRSVEQFDQDRGFSFTTYLHQAISRALQTEAAACFEMPRSTGEKRIKLLGAIARHKAQYCEDPPIEMISRQIGVSVDMARKILLWRKDTRDPREVFKKTCFSADDPVDAAVIRERASMVREAIHEMEARLNGRQCVIFRMRYFDGRTLPEIGKYFGITKERVRQVLTNQVLPTFREIVKAKQLEK